MSKNEDFILSLIKKTLNGEVSWFHADNHFSMPESENPQLYALLSHLDALENSGKCYYLQNKEKTIFLFFYCTGIQMFLQNSPSSRLLQMRGVDRSLLYRLYNSIRSCEKTDAEELSDLTDSFFE